METKVKIVLEEIYDYFNNHNCELYDIKEETYNSEYCIIIFYFNLDNGEKENFIKSIKFDNDKSTLNSLMEEINSKTFYSDLSKRFSSYSEYYAYYHKFMDNRNKEETYFRKNLYDKLMNYLLNQIKEKYSEEFLIKRKNDKYYSWFINTARQSKNYKEYLSRIKKQYQQEVLYDKLNIIKIYKPLISLSNDTEKSKNKVFDFITVEISMFGYTTNKDQLIQKIKKNKLIYDKLVLKSIKESKEFQKYQVPINILSLDDMRFMNTGHLVYKFGIKKIEEDNDCKST